MFWVMLDIMKKVIENNPNAYYLMENVRMKKEFEEYIRIILNKLSLYVN